MKIYSTDSKSPKDPSNIVLLSILAIGLIFAGYFIGSLLEQGKIKDKQTVNSKRSFKERFKGKSQFKSSKKLETVQVDMDFKEYQKLAFHREQALERRINYLTDFDNSNGKITYKGKQIKANFRLKGIFSDHWIEPNRWSLKVSLKGDNTIMGMKEFALVVPKTRDYIFEWLYSKILQQENLIYKRIDYVNFVLNGKNQGPFIIEEGYDKRLLENNKLREAPIVSFSKDSYVNELYRIREEQRLHSIIKYDFQSRTIDSKGASGLDLDSKEFKLHQKAITLLEGFRKGDLKTSEVFDTKKMAKFLAIKALFGSGEFDPNDTKFYFNPVTTRLEPIGAEIHKSTQIGEWWLNDINNIDYKAHEPFVSLFFQDNEFTKQYVIALKEVSDKAYLDNLLISLDDEIKEKLAILKDNLNYYDYDTAVLYTNQSYIRRMLNPVFAMHAYYDSNTGKTVSLKLGNVAAFPVEILHADYKGLKLTVKDNNILAPRKIEDLVDYQKISFNVGINIASPNDFISNTKVYYKILGTDDIRSTKVHKWTNYEPDLIANDPLRKKIDLSKFKFIERQGKNILIKAGQWELTENLLIPAGHKLLITAGTKLILKNGANIISYSPISFSGAEEMPVIIEAADQSQSGIIVIQASTKSYLNYVIFNNLTNPSQAGFSPSGAVNFYESPVTIENCIFRNNRSEDSLNVIRTELTMSGSSFENSFSDALDLDYAKAKISSSTFVNLGNDAIDTSGSFTDLNNIRIDKASDKAVSAGENSNMKFNNLVISNCELGLVSKDKSSIEGQGLQIVNTKVGFTLFQKKPEFGPGRITVQNIKLDKVTETALVEAGSTLIIDGKQAPVSSGKIKDLLYGVQYGKKTVK